MTRQARIRRMKFYLYAEVWHHGGVHDPCWWDSAQERDYLADFGIENHEIKDCDFCKGKGTPVKDMDNNHRFYEIYFTR